MKIKRILVLLLLSAAVSTNAEAMPMGKTPDETVEISVNREAVTKLLSSKIGKKCAKEWSEKIASTNFERKTNLLFEDLNANPKLAKALRNNTDMLRAYAQCIEAPKFRGDINILTYLESGADKFADNVPSLRKKWGTAEQLTLKEEYGVCEILDRSTGDLLGTIDRDAKGNYVVECSQNNRTLLNLYPLGNASYVCGPHTWITDAKGRVYSVRYSVTGREKVEKEDKKMPELMEKTKNSQNADGRKIKYAKLDDQGGHLIPLESGGTNDVINFVPQNTDCDNGGMWKSAEKASASETFKRSDKPIDIEITIEYPDKSSLRPKRFVRTHMVNGKPQTIGGNKMKGQKIDNPAIELAAKK